MWQGCFVALVTPFTSSGEVDFFALRALVSWHLQEKTDGIVVCGTTGETPTLSDEEQEAILQTVLNEVKGRIPVIMGTGSNDTRKSVQRTEKAKKLGADGCLVVVPYYNRPTPEGCFLHYQAIASVGLPIIVYLNPSRTGVHLSVEAVMRIAALPEVAMIKDCTGELQYVKELIAHTKKPLFSGDDVLTLPIMEMGGVGVISIVANLIPSLWKEFVLLLQEGQVSQAEELEKRYITLCQSIILETNPQGVKYALSLLGRCQPFMRLPLIEPRASTKVAIQLALEDHLIQKNLSSTTSQ
jgi:4-hydroxy-tetrahydrodipicolinate synthase